MSKESGPKGFRLWAAPEWARNRFSLERNPAGVMEWWSDGVMKTPRMEKLSARSSSSKTRRIYAIGGGKGGTGKSFLTASLGLILAQQGKKVLLIDLDLGSSNLHTFLSIKKPHIGLKQYLDKRVGNLEEVALPTYDNNLSIITSVGCSLQVANLHYARKLKILRAIRRLSYDYILLDLGAGTHFNTIDFFLIANEGLLVTTPEPISIENMFRFIKSVYLRKLRIEIKNHGLTTIFQEALKNFDNLQYTSPSDLIKALKQYNNEQGIILENKSGNLKIKLILNQLRRQVGHSFGQNLANVCKRHLYFDYEFIGNITHDTRVGDAAMQSKTFVDHYRYTKTALELKNIASIIMANTSNSERFQSITS